MCLDLQPNTLSLLCGRSGAGKSTLLAVLAGLAEADSGSVSFSGPGGEALDAEGRMARAGLVFQFPERHFVGGTLAEELCAGWPSPEVPGGLAARQALGARAGRVLPAVGLGGLPLDVPLRSLSDGYKR